MRHAEAVLLVDDDEAEPAELHRRLDQGVRADEDVDRAGGERREQLPARGAAHAPGQQPEAHARPRQPGREALGVLLGEDLGRRHEGALRAVLGGEQQREARDDGLADADVALEQSRHRASRAQIRRDLPHRPLLGAGQRERAGP